MASHKCSIIQNSAPWIAAIAVLLTFANFFFYAVLYLFFTSLLLILSTNCLFPLSKKDTVLIAQKTVQDHEVVISSEENNQPKELEVEVKVEDMVELVTTMSKQNKQESQEKQNEVLHEIFRSSDLHSKSETIDQFYTSTNYSGGVSWMSQDFSDGSISDEESLIEIALPSGQYVSPNFNLLCSAEAMFKQHNFMEFLAEFNEENLIEIDISMGSIKCSRFEIEA